MYHVIIRKNIKNFRKNAIKTKSSEEFKEITHQLLIKNANWKETL